MKKVIVIGCPGSGKSTFAIKLKERTGLPLYHLDMLYWNKNKTTVSKEEFLRRLYSVTDGDEWIIDGNYGSTMELRLACCDTVFFLDYPTELCLQGIETRRGKPRPDMPWVESDEDAEFIEFVKSYATQQRPQVTALLEKYKTKRIIVFKSRRDATEYLNTL